MSLAIEPVQQATAPKRGRRAVRRRTSLFAHGEPMVWLTGGSLAIALVMIAGLLALILYQGGRTFWPGELVRFETVEGRPYLGEVTARES